VLPAGNGGNGGSITISARRGILTFVNNSGIAADGGDGGNQFGQGGKGGDSNDVAGKGGDVKKQGDGGNGGTIIVSYNRIRIDPRTLPLNDRATRSGGKKGIQNGKGGAPGKGPQPIPPIPGTVDDKSARPGDPGRLLINSPPVAGGPLNLRPTLRHQPVLISVEGAGTFAVARQSGTIQKVLFPRLTLQGKVSVLGNLTGMLDERFESTGTNSGMVTGSGTLRWFGGSLKVAVIGPWTITPGSVPTVAANLEFFRSGSPGARRPGAFSGLGTLKELASLTPQGQLAPNGAFTIQGAIGRALPGGPHGRHQPRPRSGANQGSDRHIAALEQVKNTGGQGSSGASHPKWASGLASLRRWGIPHTPDRS
jgi:hypothetical protein